MTNLRIFCCSDAKRKLSWRTSTAQPIQSNPGPRFAIVAGANALASLATGCLTSAKGASALQARFDRFLRKIALLSTLHDNIRSPLSPGRLLPRFEEHLLHGCSAAKRGAREISEERGKARSCMTLSNTKSYSFDCPLQHGIIS